MKKIMLLTTMAVAAVAFAAPAMAQAEGMFTHEGNEIPENETVMTNLSGWIGFETEGVGSFECEAHPELSVGTFSADFINLNLTTEHCKGTGGFSHCKLVEDSLTSGSTLTPTATEIDLQNFKLFNRFVTGDPGTNEGGTSETACSLAGLPAGIELEFANVTLTPDNAGSINEITEISGVGIVNGIGIGPIATAKAYTSSGLVVAEGQEGTIDLS